MTTPDAGRTPDRLRLRAVCTVAAVVVGSFAADRIYARYVAEESD
ncbi:hypothetical protein [Halopelagius fulvigenes]|uniref:Uncharacterized protein n=1 Tax=Halopelagius fulvigenes TaxID=1198324 RepID=A0ABD5U1D8_9EURY